jgi:hypothetical protein
MNTVTRALNVLLLKQKESITDPYLLADRPPLTRYHQTPAQCAARSRAMLARSEVARTAAAAGITQREFLRRSFRSIS